MDSAKQAADAIPVVMEVIEEFGQRRRKELEENRFYQGTVIPSTALRYMHVRAGGNGNDMHVGEVSFSVYTDKTKEEILAEYAAMEETLKQRLEPMGIVSEGFQLTTRFFHYAYAEPDCPAIAEMQQAAMEASGRWVNPCGSCLSDLSVILKYGSKEAFGFGVGRDFNAYGGAHQPDEYISCDVLLEYAKIMGTYILNSLG